jgi:hypothetical protein
MTKHADKTSKKDPAQADIDAELEAMDAQLAASPGAMPPHAGAPVKTVWPSDKAPSPPKRYRVLAKRTLSVEGRLVTLSVGDVVSADHYGPVAVEHILSGGTPVEEIKD